MEPTEVVLVTGASGLLGRALARRLAPTHRVVGLDRQRHPAWPDALPLLVADVTDEPGLAQALDQLREDHGGHLASVVHLLAYYDFTGAEDPRYDEVTVEGTSRLVRLLRDRFTVEQLVFSSTMLVHAPVVPGERITESSPVDATWAYPRSKAATEARLAAERGEIPLAVLRIAGVYDEDGHSPPLADQIRRIAQRRLTSRAYPAPLDRGQDFVHLDDVVAALAAAVDRRDRLPEHAVALVGSGTTYGYGTVQDAIGRALGRRGWATVLIPQPVARVAAEVIARLPGQGASMVKPFFVARAGHHYALDVSAARFLLGWEAAHDLLADLPEMVRRRQADPAGWARTNGFAPPGR